MKARNKILTISVFTLLAAGTIMLGCRKKANEESSMTVKMTDAPANFSKINVEVVGLEINNENKGKIDLPIKQGVYDLLELQNNVSVVLADNVKIPIGKINQIRLLLGTNNSIQDSLGMHPLTIPSGSETGLKLNVNQEIVSNHT